MPEELLKMSSQFRKDMRKLNMLKEVKVLIENQQQMGILSDSQKLITKKFKRIQQGIPISPSGITCIKSPLIDRLIND
jgi:hypothetical protein